MSDPSDMDAMVPQPVPLTLDGVELQITPLRVGEIAPFARAVSPLADALPLLLELGEPGPADMLALLRDHGDHVLQALAVASRQPLPWVQHLQLHDAAELAAVCIEVNADFFRQAQPSLARHAARVAAVFSPGQTPSRS